MNKIKYLEEEIKRIKERNKRVEADKSWETSKTRKILIFIFTYIVVVSFFLFANIPNPLINSIVPAVAFVLSTLTLSFFKKLWLKYVHKK